jgi:molybdopterin-guanine dinucleotide biosynthesis protein A
MFQIPCVIFAGGKSSRMGEDKALLPFAGKPTLTQYQYERLQKLFQNVYISCKDASKFDFLTESKDAIFIEDINTENIYAPTTGFVTIFNRLHVNEIFVLSVDTPFIGEIEISKILEHKDQGFDAIIAKTPHSLHPLCGLYNRSLHVAFSNMLQTNQHKLTQLLHMSKTLFIEFEDESNFLNLNHPSEYEEAVLRFHQEHDINK